MKVMKYCPDILDNKCNYYLGSASLFHLFSAMFLIGQTNKMMSKDIIQTPPHIVLVSVAARKQLTLSPLG